MTLKKIWRLLGKLRTGCNSIPSGHMFLFCESKKKTLIWNLLSLRFKQVRFFFFFLFLFLKGKMKKKKKKKKFTKITFLLEQEKKLTKNAPRQPSKSCWEAFFPNFFLGKGIEKKALRLLFLFCQKNSYLVDPASSHMLVSKIKPCMSKYKWLYTVKLRMAH